MAILPREQLPKSQLGKDRVAEGPELMAPGLTSWSPSRPRQTPLLCGRSWRRPVLGCSCGIECGRGGWMPWYSGADGGTVRTGWGCRRMGHCGGKWNKVGEPDTAVCLGRFGGIWQRGLGCMLPAGGKLHCTDPEEDTDVPEPWKMRLGCRLMRHQQ